MKMQFRKKSIFVTAVILFGFLTACGPSAIDVALGQYEMTLSPSSAQAGEIVFHIHNDAVVLVHEFVIVKSDLPADSFTIDPNGTIDESQMTVIDEVEDIHPSASADLTITLEAGHYILLCNLPTHYGLGMYANFTVHP